MSKRLFAKPKIYQLLKNTRLSYAKIGKQVGTSREYVYWVNKETRVRTCPATNRGGFDFEVNS